MDAAPISKPTRFPAFLRFLEPDPAVPITMTDPVEIKTTYRHWQKRILISSIIGYALFYIVRKNLSSAMPAIGKELGITKTDLGLFLTLHGLLYGVSKFLHGFLGDRSNARTLMATGLILSAVMNVCFGFSSAVITFGIFWMLNGWVQGMGFPPCARLMTHWFSPHELATKMSFWNISHSLGGGIAVVLGGYLVGYGWRLCFIVPAILAFLGAIFVLRTMRDTPPSLGLPEVEGTARKPADGKEHNPVVADDYWVFLRTKVFNNPYLRIVSLATFFVYTVRYSVLDWGPTFLSETKHIQIQNAGWMVFSFEVSGIAGMLLSGWLTDRFFEGRGVRMCVLFMALAGVSMLAFWKLSGQSAFLSTVLLCSTGFFIYGPQALIGTISANLGTKRAAAAAVGLTSIFGYASTALSGVGLGKLVETRGWDAGFAALVGIAAIGTVVFALAWKAKANGYEGND